MEFIKLFLNSISDDYSIITCEEDFNFLKIKIKLNTIISPISNIDTLESLIIDNIGKDIIKLFFIQVLGDGNNAILYTYSKGEILEEFLSSVDDEYCDDNLQENEYYVLEINIDKNSKNEYITVYCLDKLLEYMNSLNLAGLLYDFNQIIIANKVCIFYLKDRMPKNIYTNSIYFTSDIESLKDSISIEEVSKFRKKMTKSRIKVCNFIQENQYSLLASDFNFVEEHNISLLDKVFEKLKIAMSLISICDISTIEKNKINITINGYKRIEETIDFNDLCRLQKIRLYDIYRWVYSDGEINDKIGIVRNIITISMKEGRLLNIDENIYESILSSYEIYLKENVERYIEVKEKLNDVLFDLSKKISDTANEIGKDLRNNVFGIVTFFITVILTNSINDGSLEKIFTNDITKLTTFFIIGSTVYMFFSSIEAYMYKVRARAEIKRVENIYTDILNKNDISNILKKYDFEKDLKYMDSKIIFYIALWTIFLIIITFCMISLSGITFKELLQLII